MTSTTEENELRDSADALRWYHTIDLGHGVVTRGVDDTPLRRRQRAVFHARKRA